MFELLSFLFVGPVAAPAPNPQRARVAAVVAYASMQQPDAPAPTPKPAPTPVKPGFAPAIKSAPPAAVAPPAVHHAVGVTTSACPGGVCPLKQSKRK
ncbi:MAG: hypothetical protein QM811_16760 [Pirellulales bacterium]